MLKFIKNLSLGRFKDYKRNVQGVFSINAALASTVILGLVGLGVDTTRFYSGQERLQSIADIAALAALSEGATNELRQEIFREYIVDMVASEPLFTGEPEFSAESYSQTDSLAEMTSTVRVPMNFLFVPDFVPEVKVAATTSTEKGLEEIEVVLALDISSSMNGQRIVKAKEAAIDFVEILLKENSNNDRVAISLVPFGGSVRVPYILRGMKTTPKTGDPNDPKEWHADWRMKPHWIDGNFNFCFRYQADEVVKGFSPTDRWPRIEDFYSWNRSNPWCPKKGNEFIPLTRDKDKLVKVINGLTLSDGTGTDHAMAWSRVNLDPRWKTKLQTAADVGPKPVSKSTRKFVVLLSDGGATGQHHVLAEHRTGSLPYYSRRKWHYNNTVGKNNLQALCDLIDSEGTVVYSIGFLLNYQREVDELANCASRPTTFFRADQTNLRDVFRSIASQISPQRLKS